MDSAIAHVIEEGEQRTSDVASGSISFDDLHLHREILKGLRSHRFLTPTKIQAAAIPMVLAGMDLLVQSKSGTGKTLIYVLSALQIIQKSVVKPQILIIVPTRELAIQVEDTANGLSHNMHSRKHYLSISYIGGTDVSKDRARMAKTRIVVGTPGRLMHLIQNKVFNTSAIRLLVLDEVDQLYATESLRKDIQTLVESLPKCQKIACSATYPDGLDERLAKMMHNPILVSNSERATVLLGIRQFVYELPDQVNSMQEMLAKLAALHKIFGQLSYQQSILFANSQSRADSFCNYLQRDGVECDLMSGSMKQSERTETFQAYRNFKMRTMVATDLMARGVDSSHADLIINLDVPKDLITYLHRIGRAGRFGSKGIAITFISSPQQSQKFRRFIAEAGTGMSVMQFPTEKREGFNFWDYDSYDFPYFLKAEGHEQEDCELKRIKQRWKGPTEQALDTELNPRTEPNNTEELLPCQADVEQLEHPRADPEELMPSHADESPQQIPEVSLENVLKTNQNDEERVEIVSQKPEIVDAEQQADDKQPVVRLIPKQSVQHATVSQEVHTDPQQHQSNKSEPLEIQQSPMEPFEYTPSIEDLPVAAPNSINTKTYCLMPPTERSSTTLHPQAMSNTVDDASSIISDSMDNDYDSDASYSSFFSQSDAQLIWHRAITQRKLQKRRQRNAKRRICIYNWRRCSLTSFWYGESKPKWAKNPMYASVVNVNDSSDVSTLKYEDAIPEFKGELKSKTSNQLPEIHKAFDRLRLLEKFENKQEIQNALRNQMKRCQRTMQDSEIWFNQLYDAMQHLYYDFGNRKPTKKHVLPATNDLRLYNQLIRHVNGESAEQLHPDPINEGNKKIDALNKLTVHVNQQFNIPPVNVAAEDTESAAEESVSESGSLVAQPHDADEEEFSEHNSAGSESPAPYSSSGFVESAESASSGIETSQYDTNSSVAALSDEYEEEDEEGEYMSENEGEETSTESQTSSCSVSTLTAETEDTENETDEEEEQEEDNTINAAVSELALAQARWHNLFQMQYQFIANYVQNYMHTYRRQY